MKKLLILGALLFSLSCSPIKNSYKEMRQLYGQELFWNNRKEVMGPDTLLVKDNKAYIISSIHKDTILIVKRYGNK